MGEAKIKVAASRVVPPDVRDDIGKIVRSVKFVTGVRAGHCWYTNFVGLATLQLAGLQPQTVVGGMVYRCGPDRVLDVVAWCSAGNRGMWEADGAFTGHIWLRCGYDLVDFSVGLWREEAAACVGMCIGDSVGGPLRAPIWTAPPLPDFFWAPYRVMTGSWKPTGTPPLGEAWYGPFVGKAYMRPPQELARCVPHLTEQVERALIRERILAANT